MDSVASADTIRRVVSTGIVDAKVLVKQGDRVVSADVGRVNATIDDEVHTAARMEALRQGLKFHQYVERALREQVERDRQEAGK
jgi:hypothetical protein